MPVPWKKSFARLAMPVNLNELLTTPRMKKLLLLLIILLAGRLLTCNAGNINIIPLPVEIKEGAGIFRVSERTKILVDPGQKELEYMARLTVEKLTNSGGPALSIAPYVPGKKLRNSIVLTLRNEDKTIGDEGYILNITKNGLILSANSGKGIFYGLQSLYQLFPPEIEKQNTGKMSYQLPVVLIRDYPRFDYRGMHLDVCRHMFPLSFIKKYIDLMAMYKMNTFHWHLTDDQGWRIEIKKYPRLTQIGSTRTSSPKGKTDENDGIPYGGFYTQSQVREIVDYASKKYITVIPEIEMPGHSVAALTAYPWLSCTGGPFQVRTEWGISDDILCAGNDSTFTFIEDVLTEIMDLFPSKYLHVGGDEAPKIRWESCAKCQSRIRTEGLKNEMELQSYLIRRVERFLSSKGRRLIGWDEILEGGLAPEATVMSWRGIQGGIDAARQAHDVIMTPTNYCYFDYYQADPSTEPLAIGGYVTLKTVYSYEPVPAELTPEEGRHILGAQGNLWTEYLSSPEMVEYMAYPRAIALSEVNWSAKDSRNWNDFLNRMDNQFRRLDYLGVKYSKGSFQVEISTVRDSINHLNLVKLDSETKGYEIRYTIDGTAPSASSNLYTSPFPVKSTTTVKACLFSEGKAKGNVNEREVISCLTSGKPVIVIKPFSYKYSAGGDQAMTDGILAGSSLRSGWQGYEGTDMEIVIDLLAEAQLHTISARFLQSIGAWILYPLDVEYLTSLDGTSWQSAGTLHTEPQPSKSKADRDFTIELPGTIARYIKVKAKNNGVLPDWHEYKGEPCWIFVDEITAQ